MAYKYLPNRLYQDSEINFNCPNCHERTLTVIRDSVVVKELAISRMHSQEDYYHPEHEQNSFSMQLICQRARCEEVIQVIGEAGYSQDYDSEGGYERFYDPLYFYPPIPFIPSLGTYPDELKELVVQTCSLLPGHHHAAIQHIRKIIEFLLDELGFPGKNLNRRIEAYQGDYKSHFEALKWVGNVASHNDMVIAKRDVESCCTLIDAVMQAMYKHETNHDALINSLKSTYGPRDKE